MSGHVRPVPQGIDSRAANVAPLRRDQPVTFELLPSKLDVPLPRPGLVERKQLVERLSHARNGRFVSIVAAPGYGKTTALAQWAARDPREFAWVSLDQRDNDPALLLTYIAEALNSDGVIEPEVFKGLTAAGDALWAAGLPRLGRALATRSEPVVLVLDDVHEIEEHACLDALAALLLHVPRGSQLVLSGRAEAALGLAKLRADGELLELGAPALALSDAEAHELLRSAGVDASETQATALNEHAEGWAAGIYLAALSLEGADDPTPLSAFGGDDRFVTDYLRSEQLARLAPDEVEFLTRSAVLDSMSGTLCDAVLERHDSARMLEALETKNLLVIPLDHRRQWFRYHHLLREMLQAELQRREPELVATLNRRAAAWCEARGDSEAAIEYAAAAGDVDVLARLVSGMAFPFYRTGRVSTVERWLTHFDDPQLLERYPAIAVFGVWLHALRGHPDKAERWAAAAEVSEFEGAMPDGSPVSAWASTVRALLCRRGVDQMREDAEAAVAELSGQSPWRGPAMLLHGVSVLLSGDTVEGEVLLSRAAEVAAATGATYAGVVAHSERALLALERGDLSACESEVAQASAFVDDAPSADYVVTAILLAARARLAIAQGQGARARETLAAAQRVRPMMTHVLSWFSVQARLELAKAHLDLSDASGAATLYHEADDILRRRSRLGTLVQQAEEVRARLTTVTDQSSGWASTLTAAELRLLPLLTTHLSFREIAERLFVSRNTVKTQAISVYRKLDASSRSEAIERAVEYGLVNASPASRQP
jgi:LuxR family transcriptional regulator, maltose regulon positive regulatory protein